MVGQPLTVDREAGAGGSRDTGAMEGEGPSTVVGTRGIIEAVGEGEVGEEEGMGMEEMEVYVLLYIKLPCRLKILRVKFHFLSA